MNAGNPEKWLGDGKPAVLARIAKGESVVRDGADPLHLALGSVRSVTLGRMAVARL